MAGKILVAVTITTMAILTLLGFSSASMQPFVCTHKEDGIYSLDVSMKEATIFQITTDELEFQSTEDAFTSKQMTSAANDGSVTSTKSEKQENGIMESVVPSESTTSDSKMTINIESTIEYFTSDDVTTDDDVSPTNKVVASESTTSGSTSKINFMSTIEYFTTDDITTEDRVSPTNKVLTSESTTSGSTTKINFMSTIEYFTTDDITTEDRVSPTNEAVTCSSEDLPNVTNGFFSCGNRLNVGDVCHLTCIENHYPSSLSQTTCLNVGNRVGNWSNVSELLCSAVTCSPDDLPDVTSGSFSCSEQVNVGDLCDLTCTENFYPSSLSQTTCLNVGNGVGNWSNTTELLCSAVTCSSDDLPHVTNGFLSCGDPVNVGVVCNLTCRENYHPSSPSQITCLNVGNRVGNWSNVSELLCTAVICSSEDLPDVTNGSFNCGDRMMVGEVCNLTCRENYYPSLLSQTTCLNVGNGVGKWSNVTELVCSVNTCSFEDLPDVTSGVFNQSKCPGQNIDAVCKITCSPGLYPDYSASTACRSVDGKKAEWMVENDHECKDYWSETMMACIRGYNDLLIEDTDNIEVCKELCVEEESFACLSVDFGSHDCYLSSRNRHNIDSSDDFVVPCYAKSYVYAERIDIAAWSSEVNTCEDGLGYLWSGSLIDLASCKLICSQTIGCCSLMFKNGMCHLNNYKRTPSNGCIWVYTERIDKFCPIK